MIRCYCMERNLSFGEFGYEAEVLFPELSLGMASRKLWREHIVPLWELRQWCPF